jgi:cytidylate kinase
VIVTISREYGAAGLAVADGVARALGYELMTDDLPAAVAARLGTSTEEIAARVDSETPISERMLIDLGAATPEDVSATLRSSSDFDEDVRREIDAAIRERAAEGDVVILGRLGNAVLAGFPNLLRVFLTAGRAWRIARLGETFGFTAAEAAREVERKDAARRKVSKERYNFAWGDPRSYDLVADTSRFGLDGTVDLIVAAARAAGA